jgi:hypothetical protein
MQTDTYFASKATAVHRTVSIRTSLMVGAISGTVDPPVVCSATVPVLLTPYPGEHEAKAA